MGLSLNFDDLVSREVRRVIGERVVAPPEEPIPRENIPWLPDSIENSSIGDKIHWVKGHFERFTGFEWKALKDLPNKAQELTASELWGAHVTGVEFLLNFNWSMSDEAIDETVKQLGLQIAAQLGTTIGCSAGHIVGGGMFKLGYVGSAKLLRIPSPLVKRKLKKLNAAAREHFIDELSSNLSQLLRTVAINGGQVLILQQYKHYRNQITWAIGKLRGLDEEQIKQMQDKLYGPGAEPFVINEKIEDSISNIDNEYLRTFTENAWDEFKECYYEIGFVMAEALDNSDEIEDIQEAVIGVERTVAITPDRTAPEETIVIAGNEESVKTTATTVMAFHQLLENRDVQNFGDRRRANELPAKPPKSTLSLQIFYSPLPDPPFSRSRWELLGKDEDLWTEPDIKIPFVDPSELTWEKIKRHAGGENGFNFGKIRASGKLGGRTITVFGSSEAEAERWLESLAELSGAPLLGITSGGRRKKSTNPKDKGLSDQYKTVKVYPRLAIVSAQRLTPGKGRASLQGEFSPYSDRVELWTDDAPRHADEILKNLKKFYTPLDQLGIGFT